MRAPAGGHPPRRWQRAVTALALLLGLGASQVAPALAAVPGLSPAPERPVVVLGMTGVRWTDVDAATTPALASLAERGAVGSTVVRSLRPAACPADGWLALSAGTRAADTVWDGSGCRPLTAADDGTVPFWGDLVRAADTASFGAQPGRLGEALTDAGVSSSAIGPGAALALALPDGTVAGDYAPLEPDVASQVAAAVDASDVVVVDLGSVRSDGTSDRATQVQEIDARLAAALAGAPAADVVVTSLADAGTRPHLQVAALLGPGYDAGALLESASTRQPGYVLAYDVTATVLAALGLDTAVTGAPLRLVEDASAAPADQVAALQDDARKSDVVRDLVPVYYVVFMLVNLALYGVVSFGLTRWQGREARSALTTVRAAAVAVAALPVASYLANLVPWWRAPAPGVVVALLLAVLTAAVTAAGLVAARRWGLLAPLGVVAGATAVLLAADVATGARLQLTSLMGTQPLVAGRFYGFNNTAFALFATVTILLAVAVASPLVARGRRMLAAVLVALLGAVAVALDGLPSIGADFGGPPALVPAFAVLALMTAGVRLTWRRLVGVGAAAVVVVGAFAVADWTRPPAARTHLGAFVQTVLDGGVLPVIARKAEQNLANLVGSWFTVLAVGGLVAVFVALGRPLRHAARSADGGSLGWLSAGTPLGAIVHAVPMLRPGLIALAVAHGLAFLLNDSGIVIPAIGIAVAVPLLLATYAGWLRDLPAEVPTPD